MKKIALFLILGFAVNAKAQTPTLINYQGALRDAQGKPLSNREIDVRMRLFKSGILVLEEEKSGIPLSQGIFAVYIGSSGALDTINMKGAPPVLEVSVDFDHSGYRVLSEQSLVSVPSALYAKDVESAYSNGVLRIGTSTYTLLAPEKLMAGSGISVNGSTITNVAPDVTVTLNAGNTNVHVSGTYPDFTVSTTPSLSISGNTISISHGNSVSIPTAPSASIVGTGAVSTTTLSENSFSLHVPVTNISDGTNVNVTGSYPDFTISATPTLSINGNTLGINGGNVVSLPVTSLVSTGAATVTPLSTNSFSLHVPQTNINQGTNVNVTGSYPDFTISATPTLSINGNTLGINGGNVVSLPVTSLVSTGAATITPLSTNSFSLHVPQTSINQGANVTVTGTFPDFTVAAQPTLLLTGNTLSISNGNNVTLNSYSAGTGITLTGSGPVYTINTTEKTTTISTTPGSNINLTGTAPSYTVSAPAYSLTSPSSTVITLSNGVNTSTVARANFSAINGLTLTGSFPSYTIANATGTNALWSTLGNAGTNTVTNFIGTTDARNLVFRTNNNPAVTIFTSGNLAMGTSNPVPDSRVHLVSTSQNALITMDGASQSLLRSNVAGVTKGYVGYINQGATGMGFMDNTGTFTRFLVTDIGNAGLGTTSPGAKLDIVSNSFAFLRMATTHSNSNVNVDVVPSGSGNLQIAVNGNTGNGFLLRTNGSDRIFVGGNGNVGINTSSPSSILHVNGSTRISDGTEGAGKVLTSDAQGNASWQMPAGAGGPTGMVIAFAGSVVPSGYLVCDGSAVSRTAYASLFAIVGTAWGEGDGSTTFNLPDMRGMFLRGVNGAATNDPDTTGRVASAPGGLTGNNVGSKQLDAFQGHGHQFESFNTGVVNEMNWYDNDGGNIGMTAGGSGLTAGDFEIRGPKQTIGFSAPRFTDETRPKNVYVYYLIKAN